MRRQLLITLLAVSWLAAEAAGAATTAPAIEVRITGVDGRVRDNVAAFLSLQRYAQSPDLDQDRVDRLALRARQEAADALKPFGYYEPEVVVTVTPRETGWKAVVAVVPGDPILLTSAEVSTVGPGRDEPFLTEVLDASKLAVGKPLSHADYDRVKGDLQRVAASRGYLDSRWQRAELLIDVANHSAAAHLVLDTGERYRFGATTIEQDFLDPEFVRRYLRYREGDWYDANLLLRTQFALDDSDYFSVVEVLPEERDREGRTVPVRISSQKNDRYRYKIGAGYATDTEWRLLLGWTNRQVNRRGHRLSFEGTLSKIEQTIDLSYTIPWKDPALEKLSFRMVAGEVENGDITTQGTSFRPNLTQVRGRWQRVLFLNADYTRDTLPGEGTDPDEPINDERTFLVVPGISYALLPPGFVNLDAAGRGLYAELLGSADALGSDSNFARLLVRDERRFDLGGRWHMILRGEVGTSAVGDFEELPAHYRFFAGGDRSVRGYGYEELSPTDEEGNRIGGRHMLVGSVEFEYDLPKNLVAAAFVDAGNAFDRFGDPLEYSVGVGIRYRLPFLLVGIDLAQSISESGRDPRLHMNFTPIL
jgi:translocation and assembly module TamA